MGFRRMAGYAGIVFVVLSVVGLFMGGSPPDPDAPAVDIAKYIADGGDATKFGGVLTALASLFAVPFIAGFLIPFLKSDREHGEGFGVTIFGGFLISGAMASVGLVAYMTLALRGGDELDAAVTRGLWDLSNTAYGMTILATVIWAGAAAMAIMKRGSMPRWFGIVTGIVALAGFTGVSGLVTGSDWLLALFVGYGLVLLWALVASIVMLRERGVA